MQEEYGTYKVLEHWKAEKEIREEAFVLSKDPLFVLFDFLFKRTKEMYAQLPQRKNGENPLIHPFNVVVILKRAQVDDALTLCAGLLHDYVEEKVDIYKAMEGIKEDFEGCLVLDDYELKVFGEFEEELKIFCLQHNINNTICMELIDIIKLLTRHKRDFYYETIINLFTSKDEKVKKMAIQIKLADRMHNILCIDSFNPQQRLYQCFKNLFILNNTKKYLLECKEKEIEDLQTEKLFKKCSKATYDAFLRVCSLCSAQGISSIKSMMHLAFKKFALEKGGMWAVTDLDERERHPMRLFHGVIRKYDARLHQEWEKFEEYRQKEREYCTKFFADYHFTPEQIEAILDYKDAYALKEVVAYLMYLPEYIIGGFEYGRLFRED